MVYCACAFAKLIPISTLQMSNLYEMNLTIQDDWKARDHIRESSQILCEMADRLVQFGLQVNPETHARNTLAAMDSTLQRLERQSQVLEARLHE